MSTWDLFPDLPEQKIERAKDLVSEVMIEAPDDRVVELLEDMQDLVARSLYAARQAARKAGVMTDGQEWRMVNERRARERYGLLKKEELARLETQPDVPFASLGEQ